MKKILKFSLLILSLNLTFSSCAFKESKKNFTPNQPISSETIGELQIIENNKIIAKSAFIKESDNTISAIDPVIFQTNPQTNPKKELTANIIFHNNFLPNNYNQSLEVVEQDTSQVLNKINTKNLNRFDFQYRSTDLNEEKRIFNLNLEGNKQKIILKFVERRPALPAQLDFIFILPEYDTKTGLTKIGKLKITKNDLKTYIQYPSQLKVVVKTTVQKMIYQNIKNGECFMQLNQRCSYQLTPAHFRNNYEEIKTIYLTKENQNLNLALKHFLQVEKESIFDVYIKVENPQNLKFKQNLELNPAPVCHTYKPKEVYNGFCNDIFDKYTGGHISGCRPPNGGAMLCDIETLKCHMRCSGSGADRDCAENCRKEDIAAQVLAEKGACRHIESTTVRDYNVITGFVITFNHPELLLLDQFEHRFFDLSPLSDRKERIYYSPLIISNGIDGETGRAEDDARAKAKLKEQIDKLKKSSVYDPKELEKLQNYLNSLEDVTNCKL
jgi:hypothetical protein